VANSFTEFVSGGPMEGGRAVVTDGTVRTGLTLVTAMSEAVNTEVSDADLARIEEAACPTCGSCAGMFTANSMNCLLEALGLALPGNGSTLATHTARRALYEQAGRTVMELAARYYGRDDDRVLPRSIASRAAFDNAMALDLAMGGSTNTVLHLLAAAHEAGLDYTLADIEARSRQVPCLCKVAPNGAYLTEDVHRAGGMPAILGELHRARRRPLVERVLPVGPLGVARPGCRGRLRPRHRPRLLAGCGPGRPARQPLPRRRCDQVRRGPGGHAGLHRAGGGDGVAGGGRRSDPVRAGHTGHRPGDPLRGARGGPGMQEMLYPTVYLKGRGLAGSCAVVTDGRFSGGSSGLSVGHISPGAAAGGTLALVEDGDTITVDIAARLLHLQVGEAELAARRAGLEQGGGYRSRDRVRPLSTALRAYAASAQSADKGAVREVCDVTERRGCLVSGGEGH
jgi:dihydroxy-acid dehydratase